MYERFTDRARKVMQLANQVAKRFNHEYVGTEHVLLGLVEDGSGVAARVLKHLNVDLSTIHVEVEKFVQSGSKRFTTGKLPQTPRTKKVIEYAMEEARNLDHNYVGTEHLLLGLLREQEGVAACVLTSLGLNLEVVRNETLQLLGHSNMKDQLPAPTAVPPYRAGDLIAPSPPRSSVRVWLLFAIAAGLGLVLVSLPRPQPGGGVGLSHPAVGKPLPPVHLMPLTFDGDPVTSADLKGRVVLLNFWGTWCPPCRVELPHISKLGEHYADDDRFLLLAVSCGDGPPMGDDIKNLFGPTAALLNQQRLSLSAYADPRGETRDGMAASGLFQHSYPTTLVVDRQGIVRGAWTGYAPGDERDVAALVAELVVK